MVNTKFNLLFLIFIVIAMSPLVSTAPPQINPNDSDGLVISYSKYDAIPNSMNFNLSVHVYNISSGIQVKTADCELELYGSDGNHIFEGDLKKTSDEYFIFVSGGNFSQNGYYSYNIYCNKSGIGGFVDGLFKVNNNGELPSTPDALIYLGLLFILLFIQVIVFWAHSTDKTFIWKFWWFAITWVLMIAITFTAWQMSNDFFTSQGFLVEFFKIVFLVLVGFFMPFIFILLFWTFFMLFVWLFLILPLKDRGFTTEEAWKQVGDRNKGKAFGKLLRMADLFGSEYG